MLIHQQNIDIWIDKTDHIAVKHVNGDCNAYPYVISLGENVTIYFNKRQFNKLKKAFATPEIFPTPPNPAKKEEA